MNIDGIDPSQIEGLKSPMLDSQANAPVQEQQAQAANANTETAKLQQLAQKVEEMPDNRPEVVERGKELLNDPNYPSPDIEDQVARILLGVQEENF